MASYYHFWLLALGLEVQVLELLHQGVVILGDLTTLAHPTDTHIVHQDLSGPGEGERELPLVLLLQRRQPVAVCGTDDHEVGVGAVVPQVQILLMNDGLARDPLHEQTLGRPRPQGLELALQPGERLGPQGLGAGLPRLLDELGEGHAVRREDARVAVEHDAADAQLGGDLARVLAARAAKGGQVVLAGLEATGLGEGADGPAHGLVGDVDEAVGDLLGGHGPPPRARGVGAGLGIDLRREGGELVGDDGGVEGEVLVRAEDGGEVLGDQAPEAVGGCVS